ncbi:MAG TPA: phage holin family protein [Bacillota bacterium]|nr:phage holin family protein [Bacillota bacterium]
MRKFLLKCLLNGLALYLAAGLIPQVQVVDWKAALLAGFGLGLIHLLIRPLLLVVALPVNLLTFGIFTLVIDTWLVRLVDWFSAGIVIPGFGKAVLTALIIAALNWLLRKLWEE